MSDSTSSEVSSPLSHASSAKVDSSHRGHPQRTLKHSIHCYGTGLHSGATVRLTLSPAEVGTGICLQRTDLAESAPFRLSHEAVVRTHLSTVVAPSAHPSHSIATIEHLMAALHAMEIDNILIQVEGPEIPILDGSAAAYAFLIQSAGIEKQNKPRRLIEVRRPVEVTEPNGACARLIPNKRPGLELSVAIDFDAKIIGKQHYRITLERSRFLKEIAFCRTFVNHHDIESLHARHMALGGSLKNAIVVDDTHILNPEGLYAKDEFVRHKTLDAIGDLYSSGYRLHGRFEGVKTGHTLNNRLLRELFSSQDNWCFSLDKRRLFSSNK